MSTTKPMRYVDLPDCWRAVGTEPPPDDDNDDDDDGARRSCRKCQVKRDRARTMGWYYQDAGRDVASFRERVLGFEIGRRWPRYWYLCERCYGDRNRALTDDEADEELRKRSAEARLTQYMLRWRFWRAVPDP